MPIAPQFCGAIAMRIHGGSLSQDPQ